MNQDPYGPSLDPTHFPADERLEAALIGKVLLDQSLDGLEFMRPQDFYGSVHQELWQRMCRLHADGLELDPVLISDRDSVLYGALIDCQAEAARTLGVSSKSLAGRVHDLAQKRRMAPLIEKVAAMSMNGVPYDEVRQYLLTELDSEERRSIRDTWQLRKASGLSEPPTPREWLLEGLIFRGQISMWYGPPGIRKSLLLMDACAAMATGQNWLVRRPFQQDHSSLVTFHATRPARILWLDYDNGEFETEIRVRAALTAREGLDSAEFYYMSETIPWLALDDASHVRRVIRLALDVGADVIVFDALGMVLGDVDENAPDVAKVIAKLKEIRAATGAAILAVHHPSKSGAQTDKANTYNAAGSAKFSNFFEWTVELRAGEEKGTIVANVVKHRGWAKTTQFSAELDYKHFKDAIPSLEQELNLLESQGGDQREIDGLHEKIKQFQQLAHELQTFKFYPAAIESTGEKRKATIKSLAAEALAGGASMNQQDLIAVIKQRSEEDGDTAIGEYAIRQELKRLAENGELLCKQSAPRQPVFYSLPNDEAVDLVDTR